MRLALFAVVCSLAVACRSTPTDDAPVTHADTAQAETLAELLEAFVAENRGVNLTYNEEVAALLASMPVRSVGPDDASVLLIGAPEPGIANASVEVIRLRYAVARELAGTLQRLISDASAGAPTGIEVLADVRTNSLLVRAGEPELARLKELVERLDVEVGSAR